MFSVCDIILMIICTIHWENDISKDSHPWILLATVIFTESHTFFGCISSAVKDQHKTISIGMTSITYTGFNQFSMTKMFIIVQSILFPSKWTILHCHTLKIARHSTHILATLLYLLHVFYFFLIMNILRFMPESWNIIWWIAITGVKITLIQ